jgi:hypothetical protein
MELRFQGSAAERAFRSLEEHVAERKRLTEGIQRVHREGGPLPLQAEQESYKDQIGALANLIGPILGDIQGFLAAVGVIASILWPADRPFRGETSESVRSRVGLGAEIRGLLDIPSTSILNARTGGEEDVRGGILHFDEMIHQFISIRKSDSFVSFDIGSSALGTAVRRESAVRWLDEDTLDLWVNERRANLRSIEAELRRTVGRIQLTAEVSFVRSDRREGPPFPFGLAYGTELD